MLKFSKGAGENNLQFPLTQEQLDNLKPCGLHSPKVGNNHGYELPEQYKTIDGLIEAAHEVAEVTSMVNRGKFPVKFLEKYYPKEWGELPTDTPDVLKLAGLSFSDPLGLAMVVEMDDPEDMPRFARNYLLQKGFLPEQANKNCIDFLEIIPETNRKISEAVERNLRKAFDVKYYYGLPRPEEVLGYNVSTYNNGCPNHPSFIAGHSAAASSVSVLIKRFNVTDKEIIKQLRDAVYMWSMNRSLASVHYAFDNILMPIELM